MQTPKILLIVEDDGSIRRLARRMLKSMEVETVEAENGQQALDELASNGERIHAVLTDMRLPDIQGDALADWIRQKHPGMPVIFFSGNHLNEQARARLEEAHTFFLGKPFTRETLADVVQKAFATVV
ncbi:MAG: response regulator [Verrucomicrobia bacterium]|nr:response regulator [Verrucomicrobiota bacterium]MCH8513684.1 response regulator [Kiritimatiellia bacterium]